MKEIDIDILISGLEERIKENANEWKSGNLTYEEFHNMQSSLFRKIEAFKEMNNNLSNSKSGIIEISSEDSYIIYDALVDMTFKAYENENKCANGYNIEDIKELADKFSKLQLKKKW